MFSLDKPKDLEATPNTMNGNAIALLTKWLL